MFFTGGDGAEQEGRGLGDHPAGQVERRLLFHFVVEDSAVCADFGAGGGHLAGGGGIRRGCAGELVMSSSLFISHQSLTHRGF